MGRISKNRDDNNKAEAIEILACLRFYFKKKYKLISLEIDSLVMKNILCQEWNIPWELVDIQLEARLLVENMQIIL